MLFLRIQKISLVQNNSVTALTGATISSKAVVGGINEVAQIILKVAGGGEQQ